MAHETRAMTGRAVWVRVDLRRFSETGNGPSRGAGQRVARVLCKLATSGTPDAFLKRLPLTSRQRINHTTIAHTAKWVDPQGPPARHEAAPSYRFRPGISSMTFQDGVWRLSNRTQAAQPLPHRLLTRGDANRPGAKSACRLNTLKPPGLAGFAMSRPVGIISPRSASRRFTPIPPKVGHH